MEVKEIRLEKIKQLENIRVRQNERELPELMESLRQNSLLQPIGVFGDDARGYIIVWGNRRFEAAKKLGWQTITAAILPNKNLSEDDFLIYNAIENLQRKETTVFELGRVCNALRKFGLSNSEIAARLSISKQKVDIALKIYQKVPTDFRGKTKNLEYDRRNKRGAVSAKVANSILNAQMHFGLNAKEMQKLFKLASEEDLSYQSIAVISALLKNGATVNEAIQKFKEYEVRHFVLCFKKNELEEAMQQAKQKRIGAFVRNVFINGFAGSKTLLFNPTEAK